VPEVLTSDRVRLRASDDGAGPPVVLGADDTAPAASRAFRVDALVGAGYRAIGLDRCEHAEAAVEGTAHGRAVVVEESGHAVNLDRPDEFNDVLLAFVREL